jgi:HD-like signal output (HDOD) protein
MNDTRTTLDRLAAKAEELHSLPAVAMQVLELTSSESTDTRALKECIENDPALTAKLLKVVNSSLFGLSRKVSDLSQALTLLGTKPLKLLVLGFSLPTRLCDGVEIETLRRYWRHTLTKAVACRKISEALYHQPGDEAFLAGLLQDLGILVLVQELGEPYARFLEKVFAEGRDPIPLEAESMGFDHTMLSGRLLAHWNLPQVLVEAVSFHLDEAAGDSTGPPPQLPHVLQLGELFARFLADGDSGALDKLVVDDPTAPGLTEEQLEAMLDDTLEQVGQLADALALELPGGLLYGELLAEAHRQLARVATDVAGDLLEGRGPPRTLDSVAESLAEESRLLSKAVYEAAHRPLPRPVKRPADRLEPPPKVAPQAVPVRAKVFEEQAGGQKAAVAAEPDPGLIGHLGAVVTACRQKRSSLSLVLVQLSDPDALILSRGVEGYQKTLALLKASTGEMDHPATICAAHGEAGFAVVVADCDRAQAAHLAAGLADRFRRKVRQLLSQDATPPGLSLGVASVSMPSKNFPPQSLFGAADRCLYASRASGGVVKSIEIY